MAERLSRVKDLFLEALERAPAERARFVRERARGDERLRRRVEELLAHDVEPEDDADVSLRLGVDAGDITRGDPLLGRRIGAYEVLRVIGMGGMGVVYEARQERPRRRVALKLLRPELAGFLSGPLLAWRLEREADLLGRLHHPGIAQVHEAGTVELAGVRQPFLAMELVEGLPITRYATERGLSMRARLELFARVCDAVQHAHQQGVIHRDLKPSNVLVDDAGAPRVLDFGVARAVDADVAATMRTAAGEIVGSVAYMSPEQAQGRSADADTRSDVYSLGVVLFELLTGRLPHEVAERPLTEALRAIAEDEPLHPSAFDRSLRGDVETIVLRAIAKEPERRYRTAADLAADLLRCLAGEPLEARRDSALYVLGKQVRRYRWAVGAALLLVLVLAAFAAYASVQAMRYDRQAERALAERAKAERFADFLEETLAGIDASVALGRDTTMLKEMMDRAARKIEAGELAAAPETELRLRLTIGQVYRGIVELEAAEAVLAPTLDLAERLHGRESAEYARALYQHGWGLRAAGRHAEAPPFFEAALALRRRLFPGDDLRTADSLVSLAKCIEGGDRRSEAQTLLEEALAMHRRLFAGDHPAVAATLHALGWSIGPTDPADAMPLLEEALAMYRRLYAGDHPYVATAMRDFGYGLEYVGRPSAALPVLEEALAMLRRLHPRGNQRVLSGLNGLRECYQSLGRHEEALAFAEEMLGLARELYPEDHADYGWAVFAVAASLQDLGRSAEALPLFEGSLENRRRSWPADHFIQATSHAALAGCLVSLGRAEEAVPLFERAIEIRSARWGADEGGVRWFECGLAQALVDLGRHAEAQALLHRAWETFVQGERRPRIGVYRGCPAAFVKLYESWHAAQPDGGHQARAAAWRSILEQFEADPELDPSFLLEMEVAKAD